MNDPRAIARLLGLEVTAIVGAGEPVPNGGLRVERVSVLPGWHPKTALRRAIERFGSDVVPLLREHGSEMWRLAEGPVDDSFGAPRLFRDVVREASADGLTYLCDLRLPNSSFAAFPAEIRAWISDEVARTGDRVRGEQIADFARNQHTRMPIFYRGLGPKLFRFDLEAVQRLMVRKATDVSTEWASEPSDPQRVLAESDTPSATAAVVAAVGERPLPWDALVAATGFGGDDLALGIVTAAELGLVWLTEAHPRR